MVESKPQSPDIESDRLFSYTQDGLPFVYGGEPSKKPPVMSFAIRPRGHLRNEARKKINKVIKNW